MGKKILVVDDEPTALRLISYSLLKEGYEVISASSGSEGLLQARQGRPDLVMLDVMMPDMNGFEVSRRLRADATTARLPIIMLTAKGQVTDKVEGFRAGADDYVVKPVDPSELVARVGAVLSRAAKSSAKKARTISFLGAKGGVGTTTVAVNVGVHIAKSAHATTLCEIRGDYGTACLQLSLRPRISLGRLFEGAAARPSRDPESAVVVHVSGLRVLAGPQRSSEFFNPEPPQVAGILDALAPASEFLLIDLPPYISPALHECLEHSTFVALVTEQEPTSLACAKVVVQRLKDEGFSASNLGAVVVHHTRSVSELTALQISNFLDIGVVGVIPQATLECVTSARNGLPMVLNTTASTTATALMQVAERLSADQITMERF